MEQANLFNDLLYGSGVEINGSNPWDIQINSTETFERILLDGSLGFGEAYMDGLWDCDDLAELINRLLRANIADKFDAMMTVRLGAAIGKQKFMDLFNPQNITQSKDSVRHHYDIGNDLYTTMLDKRLTYTCGYWRHTNCLEQAQEDKLDLICRKLNLKPGMRILDIGCGWGSLMHYAAEKYGVECDGLTLSVEQAKLGQKIADKEELPVNFILLDYREFQPTEPYDAVVSVGMIEHVGPMNYAEYFGNIHRFLKNEGVFLLHTIGGVTSKTKADPWFDRYIFPNGVIPSLSQLSASIEGLFNIEDLHNFGPCYDKTLAAWYHNFSEHWFLLESKYGDRFYRMWRYYLLASAGAFRARTLNVWQLVLTKQGGALPSYIRQL